MQAPALVVLGSNRLSLVRCDRPNLLGVTKFGTEVPCVAGVALPDRVLPAGWEYARSSPRGWDSATLALTTGALSVICMRLQRTWG